MFRSVLGSVGGQRKTLPNRNRRTASSPPRVNLRRVLSSVVVLCLVVTVSLHANYVRRSIPSSSSSSSSSLREVISVSSSSSETTTADVHAPAPPDAPVVGYVVSLTGCDAGNVLDAAAVLRRSIHVNSVHSPASGSKYSYRTVAVVHPDAAACAGELERAGYETRVRDTPVAVKDIQGDLLRERVVRNGCCGEKEYVKLWAYTFTDFPVVVHLDLDVVLLRPLDDLFDAVLRNETAGLPTAAAREDDDARVRRPSIVDALYTKDYNMVNPGKRRVGVQGAFLVLRPSIAAFEEYKAIIREGDFRGSSGWAGSGYGGFYGGMTFQGLVGYFYGTRHPGTSVELDRCEYNSMADAPRAKNGRCRDGNEKCRDCREADPTMIYSFHFTICQKPWFCLDHTSSDPTQKLCRVMVRRWFKFRYELEKERVGPGKHDVDQFYGFCKSSGQRGYLPLHAENAVV